MTENENEWNLDESKIPSFTSFSLRVWLRTQELTKSSHSFSRKMYNCQRHTHTHTHKHYTFTGFTKWWAFASTSCEGIFRLAGHVYGRRWLCTVHGKKHELDGLEAESYATCSRWNHFCGFSFIIVFRLFLQRETKFLSLHFQRYIPA